MGARERVMKEGPLELGEEDVFAFLEGFARICEEASGLGKYVCERVDFLGDGLMETAAALARVAAGWAIEAGESGERGVKESFDCCFLDLAILMELFVIDGFSCEFVPPWQAVTRW